MFTKNIRFCMTLVLGLFLSSSIRVDGEAQPIQKAMFYRNHADFACGPTKNNNTVTTQNVTMNIYNPYDVPVMVNNVFLLSRDDLIIKPEFNVKHVNILLSPQRGFTVNCNYIEKLFYGENSDGEINQVAIKGKIQSQSTEYLDVAYYYTREPMFVNRFRQEQQNETN